MYSQRYEALLKEMEKKSEQHREVLSSLQQEYQKATGRAVAKVWAESGRLKYCMHSHTRMKLLCLLLIVKGYGWMNVAIYLWQ